MNNLWFVCATVVGTYMRKPLAYWACIDRMCVLTTKNKTVSGSKKKKPGATAPSLMPAISIAM